MGNDNQSEGSITPILAVILIAVMALMAFVLLRADVPKFDEVGFGFAPLEVDTSALEAERAVLREGIRDGIEPYLSKVEEYYIQSNRAQFPEYQPADARQLEIGLIAHVDEMLVHVDPLSFVAAGEPFFAKCRSGLSTVLEMIRSKEIGPEDVSADLVEEYRDYCGNALSSMIQRGLISPDGNFAFPGASEIINIIDRHRFASIISSRHGPHELLTPTERSLLLRWQVESQAFPMQERLRFLREATNLDPRYDTERAAAIIHWEGGDRLRARELFFALCDRRKADAELQARCRFLKRMQGQGENASVGGN